MLDVKRLFGKKEEIQTERTVMPEVVGHHEIITSQGMKVPVVRYGNDEVSVMGREILIGRDPSANIVFKQNAPGVSSRHCTVSYDEKTGDFILKDLKSTYGTFLKDGKRIRSGSRVRLLPGDTFCVGDKAHVLQVDVEG